MANPAKVWIITGASRGLGRELARAVLARGDTAVGTSRNGRIDLGPDAGPGTLDPVALDVTDPAQVQAVVEGVRERHGRIDVLVNNAGSGLLGPVEEATEAEAAETFEVNFFGPLRLIRAALPILRAQRSGHIVNLSSIAGIAPGAGSGLYAASKFALEGLSQSLAQEVAPLGIRVTVVEPGAFRTDFLSGQSIRYSEASLDDYRATAGKMVDYLRDLDGKQAGDPVRGAQAIIEAVLDPEPPRQLLLGSDALARAQAQHQRFGAEMARWESLTRSTDFPKA